jgi:hypothetical protein
MSLLDLDQDWRLTAPKHRRTASQDRYLMSLNVDLDEVDLDVCSNLVVQRYGWNFDSLNSYSLEPVSETGLSSDETTVVLRY